MHYLKGNGLIGKTPAKKENICKYSTKVLDFKQELKCFANTVR